jgi:hypothetical protein
VPEPTVCITACCVSRADVLTELRKVNAQPVRTAAATSVLLPPGATDIKRLRNLCHVRCAFRVSAHCPDVPAHSSSYTSSTSNTYFQESPLETQSQKGSILDVAFGDDDVKLVSRSSNQRAAPVGVGQCV